MSQQIQYRISRRPDVLSQFGFSNTSLHGRLKAGLMPPSIQLGPRAVGWVQGELDAVLAAMVAGRSDQQLRDLVASLVDQRQQVA